MAVFPTLVGVFLSQLLAGAEVVGLPHARGGVSFGGFFMVYRRRSSPRSWGCFRGADYSYFCRAVFPTLVGVFPCYGLGFCNWWRLPHARGGVSENYRDERVQDPSSPRSWGCFRIHRQTFDTGRVFPTLVGVFLTYDRGPKE